MADSKSLKEPALRGALNRTPPPSTVPVWDPWHEPEHHERPRRFKIDPKREPAIAGVIARELPASNFKTWDPWAHGLPRGVMPPEGYSDNLVARRSAPEVAHVTPTPAAPALPLI